MLFRIFSGEPEFTSPENALANLWFQCPFMSPTFARGLAAPPCKLRVRGIGAWSAKLATGFAQSNQACPGCSNVSV